MKLERKAVKQTMTHHLGNAAACTTFFFTLFFKVFTVQLYTHQPWSRPPKSTHYTYTHTQRKKKKREKKEAKFNILKDTL